MMIIGMVLVLINDCDNIFNHKLTFGMFCVGGMQMDWDKNGFRALTFHSVWDSIYYFGA